MIAVDTSSLSALLKGESGPDIELLIRATGTGSLYFPPVVVTEILSDPALSKTVTRTIAQITILETTPGYWERAASLRRRLKERHLRSKIADALIAQSCIDYDVPLITRDDDFRHFAKHCGLRLA